MDICQNNNNNNNNDDDDDDDVDNNIMEICRDLWLMQKKLKEQLSRYGTLLETVRVNPHHVEASSNMANLLSEIVDVGKKQNQLMTKCTESISKILEKYCSEKSLLLENFRDSLIRQIWNNGVEECFGEIGNDIYKILFMNQMDLIPSNLSRSLSSYDEMTPSNTIDVANIRLKTGIDEIFSITNGSSSLRPIVNGDSHPDRTGESEPRCTRSSKLALKRTMPDIEQLKRSKSRKRSTSVIVKPNSCCTICSKLIFVKIEQWENIGTFKDNVKMLICCDQCVSKHYAASAPGSTVISNSNEEESGSPSDSSSQNNI